MKKKLFRYLSVFVMAAMVISLMTFSTTAANETTATDIITDDNISAVQPDNNSTIVSEDVSLRDMYSKHFLMSNGSYQAVTYNEPVHQLVDDEWIEVDNTLRLTTSNRGVARYETTNGIVDVSFAQSFQNQLVTMTQDDYSISWDLQAVSSNTSVMGTTAKQASFASSQPAVAEIVSSDLSDIGEEELKTYALKSTSSIRYDNALMQDVDLEYVVLPSRVKESIILQSPQNISAYVMNVYTDNLSAQLLESREIAFFDIDGEEIFTMWAPYMYDSAGALSEDIAVKLVQKEEGHYLVSIIPNATWLNDSSRVYPVVIDPDVATSRVRTNIVDNFVVEGQGNQNRNLDRLYFGIYSGGHARAFIKYSTMPTIPSTAQILEATMMMRLTSGTSTAKRITAYRVTGGDWASDTITWANMPAVRAMIYNVEHTNFNYYKFTCLPAVLNWYENSTTGSNANYGIMIRYTSDGDQDYNAVYSADCSSEKDRPLMIIRYRMPGVEAETIEWPVPYHYNITSEWGYRNYDSEVHTGIDISCGYVTVVAAIGGYVTHMEDQWIGTALVIHKPDSEFQVRYYHLDDAEEYRVEEGSTVEAGDYVAISGNTGSSTGPHLHFQLQWTNNKHNSYNPLETYNSADQRSGWTNPNPMFYLMNGVYVPNDDFNFTYTPSNYNNTDDSWGNS